MTIVLTMREIIGGVRIDLIEGLSMLSSTLSVGAAETSLQEAEVDSVSFSDDIAPYVRLLVVFVFDGRVCNTV